MVDKVNWTKTLTIFDKQMLLTIDSKKMKQGTRLLLSLEVARLKFQDSDDSYFTIEKSGTQESYFYEIVFYERVQTETVVFYKNMVSAILCKELPTNKEEFSTFFQLAGETLIKKVANSGV